MNKTLKIISALMMLQALISCKDNSQITNQSSTNSKLEKITKNIDPNDYVKCAYILMFRSAWLKRQNDPDASQYMYMSGKAKKIALQKINETDYAKEYTKINEKETELLNQDTVNYITKNKSDASDCAYITQ
jgi:hypothetical protein